VLAAYLGALVLGGGILVVQLAFGHHAADHGGGDADHDTGAWSIVGTLRFWSFALFAFGFVGALLTIFAFAGGAVTFAIAAPFGLASGAVAATVVRRLTKRGPSSHTAVADAVGRVGRVIVPPNEAGRAKVRVEVKGVEVDYIAHASDPLDAGDAVLVESCEGAELRVSRAPRELT
jgi:membrane protein implicated in regulation of membrane protease activity